MGDNVNIASRVESNGETMEVVVTNAVLKRISTSYLTEELGVKTLKGKGEMMLYIVKGRL
jgi:class 3 adenylate cyclase